MSDEKILNLEQKLLDHMGETSDYLNKAGQAVESPSELKYFFNMENDRKGDFMRLFFMNDIGCGMAIGYRPSDFGYSDMQTMYKAVCDCLAANGIAKAD
jgi:hypothetical protein